MHAPLSPTAVGSPSLSALERAAPRPPLRAATLPVGPGSSWLANQGRLPLAFMGLALAWLVASSGLLLAQPALLSLTHASPQVVALTHAWVLGFFITVACGAVYQLAPVALGTTLCSERRAWWHFGLHAVGVPGMVYSFWVWDLALLGHFGFVVTLGIILFADNTWRTVKRSGRSGAVAWSISLAAGWMLLTALVGVTLAANRFWHFIPLDPLSLLRAHAHLGLVGVFITLLQGVAFQLVPMFTLGEVRDWRLINAGLWLSQLGMIGLVVALAAGVALPTTLFALAIAAGWICSAVAMKRALATRRKRAFDPGTRWFLVGGAGISSAMVAGIALAWPGSPWGSAPGGFSAMVYALIAIAGGLLPCIAGMMCKIVPFLTWMRAYGPKVGRVPTPAASALTRPRLERWGLGLQTAAVAPLLVGAWTLNETMLQAGAWVLAAGVALFTLDMIGVLKHLWWPEIPAAAPMPAAVT
ncbi:MAG: hypothetical protein Q7S40_22710 [Opitutaceae bacterium]|nr:hypothetical protein [Opitutaceae bacterium]